MKNKILKPIVLYKTVKKSYITADEYLQQKYPIEDPSFESMAELDPDMRQMSQTHETLLSLKSFFEHFISKESPCDFTVELRDYLVDSDLQQLQNPKCLDEWWNQVFDTKRYPIISSIVRPCLNIFTGLMVKISFSMISDIIDSPSGRSEIDTYSAS